MFVGFTPSIPGAARPLLDNKFSKLFKLAGPAFALKGHEGFALEGRSIIDGFRRLGYYAVGSGAVSWFDPSTPTGQNLVRDFEEFHYPGNTWSIEDQVSWLNDKIIKRESQPIFAFLNVGETHTPYYYNGAPWDKDDNPCVPYQKVDRAADCRLRQQACVEVIDRALASILSDFSEATIIICGDHGDCWGEDGFWEHGLSHDKTLSVPLLMRVRGTPIS
jgi:hypothetical protein